MTSANAADPLLTPNEIFEKTSGSVVLIETYNAAGDSVGYGSGFVMFEEDLVATNFHVVQGGCAFKVSVGDHETTTTTVAFVDPVRDLALLRLSDLELEPLDVGTVTKLGPGHQVIVIGYPQTDATGRRPTITDGLYSGMSEFKDLPMIQLSAPISQGNSGGPVLDSFARVIGIASQTWTRGQNLNFAVPVDFLRSIALSDKPQRPADFCKAYPRIEQLPDGAKDSRDETVALDRFHTRTDELLGMLAGASGVKFSDLGQPYGTYGTDIRLYERWWYKKAEAAVFNVHAVDPKWSIVTTFIGYMSIPVSYYSHKVKVALPDGVSCTGKYFGECLALGAREKKAKPIKAKRLQMVAFFKYQEGRWKWERLEIDRVDRYSAVLRSRDSRRIYDAIFVEGD